MGLHNTYIALAILSLLAAPGCTDRNLDHIIHLWARATVTDEAGHPVRDADVVFQDLEKKNGPIERYSLCSTDTSGRCEGRTRYGYNTTQRVWWWQKQPKPKPRHFTSRHLRFYVLADGFEEKMIDVRTLTREQVAGRTPMQLDVHLRRVAGPARK
jgi:hypothetical protein